MGWANLGEGPINKESSTAGHTRWSHSTDFQILLWNRTEFTPKPDLLFLSSQNHAEYIHSFAHYFADIILHSKVRFQRMLWEINCWKCSKNIGFPGVHLALPLILSDVKKQQLIFWDLDSSRSFGTSLQYIVYLFFLFDFNVGCGVSAITITFCDYPDCHLRALPPWTASLTWTLLLCNGKSKK